MTQHDRLLRYVWRWGDDARIVDFFGRSQSIPADYIEIVDTRGATVIAMTGNADLANRITDALNRTEPQ